MAISEPKSAHLREVLLFAFNWKRSATEAHRMLEEVYGDHALSKSQCYRWFKKFQSGDFKLDNEPRGKPPQKFEEAELQALLDEDSTQTQEKLAKQLQVSQGAVSLRLNSLGMTQKLFRWVPHELSERQQEWRLVTCEGLLARHENNSFLHRIVTSDEKWIHFSNPMRQKSWGLPGQFPKQTPRPNRFGKKGNALRMVGPDRRSIFRAPETWRNGICERSGNTSYSLGTINSALTYNTGQILLKYTAGSPCPNLEMNRSTVIQFLCPEGHEKSGPVYVEDNNNCTHMINFKTILACEYKMDCLARMDGRVINLLSLGADNNYIINHSKNLTLKYILSICSPVPRSIEICPPNSGVCIVDLNNTKAEKLSGGIVAGEMKLDQDGRPYINYTSGSPCPAQKNTTYSSIVTFICEPELPSSAVLDEANSTACHLRINVRTNKVCPNVELTTPAGDGKPDSKTPEDLLNRCIYTVNDKSIDLTPFKRMPQNPYQYKSSLTCNSRYKLWVLQVPDPKNKGTFRLNICGDTSTSGTCKGSASCYNTSDGQIISYGSTANSEIQVQDTRHTLVYTDGDSCPGGEGGKRKTEVVFYCDPKIKNMSQPTIEWKTDCNVMFKWKTAAACREPRTMCHIYHDDRLWDLSELGSLSHIFNTSSEGNTHLGNEPEFGRIFQESRGDRREVWSDFFPPNPEMHGDIFIGHDNMKTREPSLTLFPDDAANHRRPFQVQRYLLSPCRDVPYNTGCPVNSAVCLKPTNGPAQSLGNIRHRTVSRNERKELVLKYYYGDQCGTAGNSSAEISLYCEEKTLVPELEYSDPNTCSYKFTWGTHLVCNDTDHYNDTSEDLMLYLIINMLELHKYLGVNECFSYLAHAGDLFYNKVIKWTFNISQILNKNVVVGNGLNEEYIISLRKDVSNFGCSGAAVCLITGDKKTGISVGDRDGYKVLCPKDQAGYAIALRSQSPCQSNTTDEKYRSSIINLLCDDNAGVGSPVFMYTTDNCVTVIDWYTNLICPYEKIEMSQEEWDSYVASVTSGYISAAVKNLLIVLAIMLVVALILILVLKDPTRRQRAIGLFRRQPKLAEYKYSKVWLEYIYFSINAIFATSICLIKNSCHSWIIYLQGQTGYTIALRSKSPCQSNTSDEKYRSSMINLLCDDNAGVPAVEDWLVTNFLRRMMYTGILHSLRFLPIKKNGSKNLYQNLCEKYGEATLDRSNVYRWYKMFSEGREDVNDEERAGRPSTSTTDKKINEVEKMILANRRITVREVAEDLNISIGSCHSIFINDLGMRRVAAKFVPKFLNCDQKQHRMNIADEMLDSVRDDPNSLQRVITGDEAWVYGYDVETKALSSQWKLPHEPRPKKARQVRSNVKVLLTVFFDCRGVVHHEFLPQGRTVKKEYYLQVMRNFEHTLYIKQ
ncbi:hypothetical protein LAZ67_11001841 [Cordylochernes scorpioides]|uniref:MRH domain-containing protein n=1 Tax=Cordylochernes scorpioides TaxID=51811 RepID=A0ABY6L2J9_9ARAC|nr:hypothetical protein LAZ67_11001841 [Cordylochernes scorpioides]